MSARVAARMDERQVDKLRDVCKLRGEDVSDFIRRAILMELGRLGYLDLEQRKALGVSA